LGHVSGFFFTIRRRQATPRGPDAKEMGGGKEGGTEVGGLRKAKKRPHIEKLLDCPPK